MTHPKNLAKVLTPILESPDICRLDIITMRPLSPNRHPG